MINRTLILLGLMVVAAIMSMYSSAPVQAKELFNDDAVCSGSTNGPTDPGTSAVCKDRTGINPLTGKDGLFVKITNIIAYVAGAAAIIVMIVSGIRFITSGGNSDKVSSAKSGVINASIGLIVIVFAKVFIVYLINKLS